MANSCLGTYYILSKYVLNELLLSYFLDITHTHTHTHIYMCCAQILKLCLLLESYKYRYQKCKKFNHYFSHRNYSVSIVCKFVFNFHNLFKLFKYFFNVNWYYLLLKLNHRIKQNITKPLSFTQVVYSSFSNKYALC